MPLKIKRIGEIIIAIGVILTILHVLGLGASIYSGGSMPTVFYVIGAVLYFYGRKDEKAKVT